METGNIIKIKPIASNYLLPKEEIGKRAIISKKFLSKYFDQVIFKWKKETIYKIVTDKHIWLLPEYCLEVIE